MLDPIVHGGYLANQPGQVDLIEYQYWHLYYLLSMDIQSFSNEDLLFLYNTKIVNLGGDYSNINLSNNKVIVKTEYETDKTLWAKVIVYIYNSIMLTIMKIDVKNDIIWWMLTTYRNQIYFAIIVKLDKDGNLLSSFSTISNINQPDFINYYFIPEFIYAYEDESLLVYGETSFYPNVIGVSNSSQISPMSDI